MSFFANNGSEVVLGGKPSEGEEKAQIRNQKKEGKRWGESSWGERKRPRLNPYPPEEDKGGGQKQRITPVRKEIKKYPKKRKKVQLKEMRSRKGNKIKTRFRKAGKVR